MVCLKSLNNSKRLTGEFLKLIKNQHKCQGKSVITVYGITKDPKDNNYMVVMQYAKRGSLQKLLDNKFYELSLSDKISNLYCIAEGLHAIHDAGLMHKNLHFGNIVNETIISSFITDVGLCKPVPQESESKEIYGVLPYVAPEILYKKEYTQKSDIYSFGIIMSEIFNGYTPYHNIHHDEDLAIKICRGYRPKINCEVPYIILDLMNKCLDADSQNRPTTKELVENLKRSQEHQTTTENIGLKHLRHSLLATEMKTETTNQDEDSQKYKPSQQSLSHQYRQYQEYW